MTPRATRDIEGLALNIYQPACCVYLLTKYSGMEKIPATSGEADMELFGLAYCLLSVHSEFIKLQGVRRYYMLSLPLYTPYV